jgi:large subunit ribosomal protein L18
MKRAQRTRYRLAKNAPANSYRFSVFRSNNHVYAQIMDPSGTTVASSNSAAKTCPVYSECKMKKGEWIGKDIAAKFKDKSAKIYFDRGQYAYHGVIKAIAEAARSAGLGF